MTPADTDRTITGPPATSADALPASTRLHEFEILSVIGQGGFGIVYLAQDTALDRRVAIKEYMPVALAMRTLSKAVALRSEQHVKAFAAGLRGFVNEARLLAQFDHPSLLKVHQFWEANGTAYMVMPFYDGITLGKLLAERGAPLEEPQLRSLLNPLLDGLELIHAVNCFHRDIAPDNILIQPDGQPLLLDFGAARQVIGDMTQALTVILKAGYAPVEQYGDMPGMTQGAWTDLYALGSVLEFAITGQTPPQSLSRILTDQRPPLAASALAGRYDANLLRTVDRCLAVLPKDRPQNVTQMRALLEGKGEPAPAPQPAAPPVLSMESAVDLAATPVAVRQAAQGPSAAPVADGRTANPRRGLVAGGTALVLVLAVAAGGYAWYGRQAAEAPGAASSSAPPVAISPTAPPATPSAMPSDAPPDAPPTTGAGLGPAVSAPPAPPAAAVADLDPTRPPAPAPPPPLRPAAAPPASNRTPVTPLAIAQPPAPAPAAAETPAPATAERPTRPTAKKESSARCASIIQRASLGEDPSEADKTYLREECGP